jgi:glycolate oxidase iron-sulfur subunit
MDDFETTGADVLATSNPGCLLQLQYGLEDRGLPAEAKYVTDLLDEAYRLEDQSTSAAQSSA